MADQTLNNATAALSSIAMPKPIPTSAANTPMPEPIPNSGPAALAGAAAAAQPDNSSQVYADDNLHQNDNPAPPRFGHFATALGKALDHPALQQNLNQPGGWAKSLVAATQGVLSGIGDARVGKVAPGGGAISGVTQALANRNARIRQQQQDAAKQKLDDAETQRQNDMASIAKENAMMAHDQILNSHLENGRQSTIKSGAMGIKPYLDANAPILQEGVDSDQINQLIRKNHLNPTQVHAFATGEKPMGEPDEEGNQPMRVTYTIVGDVPEIKIDDEAHPGLSAYISKWTGQPIQDGQTLDGIHYGMLIQQANNAETASNAQDQIREAAGLKAADAEAKQRNLSNSGPQSTALSKAGMDPIKALTQFSPDDLKKNPKLVQDTIAQWYGDKNDPGGMKNYAAAFQKRQEDAQKQAEQDKKDADKKLDKQQFGDTKLINDKDAFRKSMDPEAAALVDSIGTGHITLPNLAYVVGRKPEIVEAVSALYPDFDSAKAANYPKLYQDFSSGKTAQSLVAGSTALRHMQELWNLNTNESHIPKTPDYVAYHNKLDTVAAELAAFYKENNIPGVQRIIDDLGSTLPGTRQAAISTQAGSMGDRFDELKNQWTTGAPSKYFQSAMPHASKDADAAANFLANKGQFVGVDPDGGRHPLKTREAYDKFTAQVEAYKAQQAGQQQQNPK